MTNQEVCPVLDDGMTLLVEHGPETMASAFAIHMNVAMDAGREQALHATSPQRTGQRHGYASGFKPQIIRTLVG